MFNLINHYEKLQELGLVEILKIGQYELSFPDDLDEQQKDHIVTYMAWSMIAGIDGLKNSRNYEKVFDYLQFEKNHFLATLENIYQNKEQLKDKVLLYLSTLLVQAFRQNYAEICSFLLKNFNDDLFSYYLADVNPSFNEVLEKILPEKTDEIRANRESLTLTANIAMEDQKIEKTMDEKLDENLHKWNQIH
jgi:hypothetical protein